jgi:hypothetical protein
MITFKKNYVIFTLCIFFNIFSQDNAQLKLLTSDIDHDCRPRVSGDGKKIAITTRLGETAILDDSGETICAIPNKKKLTIRDHHLNKDGSLVIINSFGREPQVWNTSTGRLNTDLVLEDAGKRAKYAHFVLDGSKILSISDHTLSLWNTKNTKTLRESLFSDQTVSVHKTYMHSEFGERLILNSDNPNFLLYITKLQNKPETTFTRESFKVYKEHFSVMPIKTMKITHQIPVPLDYINARLNKDGNRLVTILDHSNTERDIEVFDVPTGQLLFAKRNLNNELSYSFCPESVKDQIIVIMNGIVKILDSKTGQTLNTMLAPGYPEFKDAKFSPDGKKVLATIKRSLINTEAHQANPQMYIPDSHVNYLNIFDAASGELLHTHQAPAGAEIKSTIYPTDTTIFVTLDNKLHRIDTALLNQQDK